MDNKLADKEYWFAFRIFHNKMKFVKAQLEQDGKTYFLPIRLIQEEHDDGFTYREEPIIPSLLFVHCEETYLKQVTTQYATHLSLYRIPGTTKPAIIPDREMEVFQYVLSKGCQQLENVDETLVKGNRVRIIGGLFKGAEGYITRIHGTKRFVVLIKGIAAVATTFVPRCFIEKIE